MGIFSLYKGRKVGKLAQVEALGKGLLKQRIDIVGLELDNGQKGIGLKIVAKSLLSYQVLPVSLSRDQARELAHRILRAVDAE